MNAKPFFIALCVVSLTACAQTPAPAEGRATIEPAPVPAPALDEGVLYQILLAEIAAQRNDAALAAEAYADLARKLRDPRLARRAAELAGQARLLKLRLAMLRLGVELEPESPRPLQWLISQLVSAGQLAEARPWIESLLRLEGRSPAETFAHLHVLLSRHKDKAAVLELVRALAAAYPEVPEARLAEAMAARDADRPEAALTAIDAALRLRPGWEQVALLRGELTATRDEAATLAFWREFLAAHPGANGVRLALAKALARGERYAEARAEFQRLREAAPDNPEPAFAIGLLAMRMDDPEVAEASLRAALELGHGNEDMVRFYLGQVEENRKRYEAALRWYGEVAGGEHAFESRLKVGLMLGRLGRVDEARAHLAGLEPADADGRIQVIQVEAQMLREAGALEPAYEVLSQGLAGTPESPELLYDRAMVAERLGRLGVLEADLRLLIRLQPDNAHAYNALGYTLADRTGRLDEAHALLRTAIGLAPEDPFIQDSMGWVLFKLGRLAEAIDYLRRAHAARPDPEIAAHLGEALWQAGEREEARRVWQRARELNPDNDVLNETLARLKP